MLSAVIRLFIALHPLAIAVESENDSCNPDCPQLHLSYLKDFDPTEDLSDECRNDECLILETGLIPEGSSPLWTGFCVRDKVFYAFWECGINGRLIGRKIKFACVVNRLCTQTVYCNSSALNDRCLCDLGGLGYCKGINSTTTTTTTEASTFSAVSTRDSEATTTTTESFNSTPRETTLKHTTTEVSEWTGPSLTTTEEPFRCDRGQCFESECSFQDHCYFFYDPDFFEGWNQDSQREMLDLYENLASDLCSDVDPTALGVAVESPEENVFVKNLILDRSNSEERADRRILTSGIKRQKPPGVWQGWNLELNETVLGLEISHAARFPEYIALRVNSGTVNWYYESPVTREHRDRISVLCERAEKNWMTSPDFTDECKALEAQEICSGKDKKFCCAADENGTLWLGCSGTWSRKSCRTALDGTEKHINSRWWYCGENGFFVTEFPYSNACICKKCSSRYQGISFKTCYGTEAIGECQVGRLGYSKWFCGSDGIFQDRPDFDACCDVEETACRDVDPFANVWVSCPGKKARKKTRCPEGKFFEKAEATWVCDRNGRFASEIPDYSNCDCPEGYCLDTDEYLVEWKACVGETSVGDCPSGYGGTATWKCGSDGRFENPRPDYSECLLTWVDDVQKEIEAGNDSLTIMNTINHHAKNDSRTGFREIIDVTSKCVDLFDRQLSRNGSVHMFDDFAKSYYSFLGNILTDPSVWSDVVLDNRINYTQKILYMTEQVAFSRLNVGADVSEFGNNSTVYNDVTGLCFFVSYGTDPVGSKFSGGNGTWSLEIKQVNGRVKNNFAATGLVLENALGSLMFPKGNETRKKMINAPIITFSLASKTKDSILEYKNVTVELNFKHLNKSRHPSTKLIRRRLHDGEVPSPIFGSSSCYFYGLSDWDSEGCSVVSSSERETSCKCVHLSTISVLMDVHDYVPEPTLEMISMICSGASIVSLMLTLMVFFGFESIKSERTTIGKHLCFCLLIGHVMLLTVMDKKFFYLNDEACSIVAVVFHYVFAAAFFWMAVEGHHLYRLVVVVFESDVDYKTRYLLVGYGIPVLVVGLTELVAVLSGHQAYGQDELCWLQAPGYVWAFTGPVLAITTFNLFVLVVTMKLAVVAKSVDGKYNLTSVKLWLKGWSSLSTLLGVTWLVGLGYIQYNFFFVYAFVVLNGLQGLFIFLFRCVLNDQVRGALLRQYRTRTSQYEESKTIQVNATKSISRFGKDKSGSVTTVHERRKSSVSSSLDYDFVDSESTSRKKLPCGQILQKIQKQSKRKTKKDSGGEERLDNASLPTYSECFPTSGRAEPPEETFPPAVGYADFPKRYPPIEEEPDSFDGSEIDNRKQNKY